MWSKAQICRLDLENQLLARELPQFRLYRTSYDAYVSGWQSTASRSRDYQLKLVLGSRFPDEMPQLYVVSPRTLSKYDGGGTVNAEGTSHSFHTLSNGPDGCVQICHMKPGVWNPACTCVAVLTKGIIWLEAYDAHLKTGRDLCDFCK